jgi:hypothetical protein
MSSRIAVRLACAGLGVALAASAAVGFIHVPPMTLEKMCKDSQQIRLLKVEKLNKEKGAIVFEVAESLKGEKSQITSFRHVIRTDAAGAQPILDWAGEGKTAVMFSTESKPGGPGQGLGYVFIDGYCYSVDYNSDGKYWLMLRAEPGMSACYNGSVERLRETVKDILDGKEVSVSTKAPDAKEDGDKRSKEINEMLRKNRYRLQIMSSGEPKLESRETNSGNPWLTAAWIVAGVSVIVAIIWFGWRMPRRMFRGPQRQAGKSPTTDSANL